MINDSSAMNELLWKILISFILLGILICLISRYVVLYNTKCLKVLVHYVATGRKKNRMDNLGATVTYV